MARYDAGWRGFSRPGPYDAPYRPYGPPRPVGRPGGQGRAGFRGVAQDYDPDFTGWERGAAPGGDVGGRGGEEFWDEGTIYGPARYGLGPYYDRLRRRRRSDDELREEVEEALFYDTWVDADAIRVEVSDGIVTLRGDLPDYDEIRYATDDVWDVDGVRGVRSEMTVRGEGSRSSGDGGARPSTERAAPQAPAQGEEDAAAAEKGGGGTKKKKSTAARRGRKKAASTES